MTSHRKLLAGVLVVGTGLLVVKQTLRRPDLKAHVTGNRERISLLTNGYGTAWRKDGSRDLMIVSNMRSGTTELSNLLRDSPETFVVFEPFIPILPYSYVTSHQVCEIGKPICRLDKQGVRKLATVILQNIFTCNIRSLPDTVISETVKFGEKSGQPWIDLKQCLENVQTNKSLTSLCFNAIENTCRQADSIVVKVVRLGVDFVFTILQHLQRVKVLYLARDPRAIINSRIRTEWFPVYENKPNSVTQNVDSLCYKLTNDLTALQNAHNALRCVAFEELFSRENSLIGVFKFINKTTTSSDLKRIKYIITQNREKNISDTWKRSLRQEYRSYTEKQCKPVLEKTSC